MIKAKQEEVIIKALKCYQRHLTEQISFHNAIGQANTIRKALIDELHKTEDVLDPLEAAKKKPRRVAKKK
ncbi:MAG: hypothetical protein ACNS60_07960 [Candidatus Cyclobacteriaceae bacterium M2_1C_046]